jgi:hypothetical protein
VTRGPDDRHDFSVDLKIYKLCSRCARPDLPTTRSRACRPLDPDTARKAIERKVELARRFESLTTADPGKVRTT